MSQLSGWENYYIIVGSSSGALIGLTFVVITLIGQVRTRGTTEGLAAFTSPTTVHFGAVLFVAALLSAPWPSLTPPAVILAIGGLAGVLYALVVAWRQRRVGSSTGYTPVLEDWVYYVACPFVAYLVLVGAALILFTDTVVGLFAVGAVMMFLLFLGIHNAWDLVTYIAVEHMGRDEEQNRSKAGTERTKQ